MNFYQTPSIEINDQTTFLYSPEFYNNMIADEYGGFPDRQVPSMMSNNIEDDESTDFEDEVIEALHEESSDFVTDEHDDSSGERHWTLSDTQAGALFGSNSSRLHEIRSESNAWIVIHQSEGKTTRRSMSIRGTKREIEHATRLILETIKRHDRKLPLRQNHKRVK
jgi:hypothetical protein